MPTGPLDIVTLLLSSVILSVAADLYGLEALAALVALAAARYWKSFPDSAFERVEAAGAKLASGGVRAVLIAGAGVVVLRLCLLPVLPVPRPFLADEFSHLFLADTLLHGRLANPTHPMWKSFETFHIIQQPTYSSMYFPGAAIWLAAGKLLFGHPWAGVLLSMGALCGAICWALQGWMPARWAFLGAVLAALRFGLVSYWINSYWGGAVTALGGVLVLGAVPRLEKEVRPRTSLILAVGLLLMASTRPFEGMILSIPLAVRLVFWIFGHQGPPLKAVVLKLVIPVAACLAIGGLALGYYFKQVTGSPTLLPYAVNQKAYGWPMTLPWMEVQHHFPAIPDLRDYYIYELRQRIYHTVPELLAAAIAIKAQYTWRFYLGPVLTIPLFSIRKWIRNRRIRTLLVTGGFMLAITTAVPNFPHYLSPMTLVFVAAAVMGIRHFRHYYVRGVPVGRRFTQLVPIVLVFCIAVRIIAGTFQLPVQFLTEGYSLTSWCCSDRTGVDQDRVEAQLPAAGKQLILVRYRPRHLFIDQWIYNEADIDASRVVWAREFRNEQDSRLIQYFHDRKVWLFEPDLSPPRLTPYHGVSTSMNP
jgi:hypothetical protein